MSLKFIYPFTAVTSYFGELNLAANSLAITTGDFLSDALGNTVLAWDAK